MTNQGLNNFNKFYLFKLKALALSCIFIFCFEVVAAYEEVSGDLTRTPSIKSPADHSVRSSVWRLSAQGDNGTGFFIASDKFITNFHVITGLLQHVSKVEDITLSQAGIPRILKIKEILAMSALHDLALIETTGSVDHYLPIRQEPLQEQEDVFITGYPDGKLADIRKTSDSIMFSRDTTSFFVNHSSLGGFSGSPVVDAKKQVVGVLDSSTSNSVYSVNLEDLQVFVQEGLKNVPRDNLEQVVKREIKNLRNLAKEGYAPAQFRLGMMYYEGREFSQNYERAAHWYTKAAEQGHADAQYHLGQMYYEGYGVPQNYEKAIYWYTKAAEQGYAPAQNNLGMMYTQGLGVPQNYEKAIDLFKQAAEQGDAPAQNNLGVMYIEGTGVPQNDELAVHWYTKAAEQGYADAQYHLGVMYTQGLGVTQNDELAIHWYRKSGRARSC